MRDMTSLWQFTDPVTGRTFACHRDEKWEAEEAFAAHLKKLGIKWDEDQYGELGDHLERKGVMHESAVWEV